MGKIHALLCAAIASACASSAPVALARGTKCALKNAKLALKSAESAAALPSRARTAYDDGTTHRADLEVHTLSHDTREYLLATCSY